MEISQKRQSIKKIRFPTSCGFKEIIKKISKSLKKFQIGRCYFYRVRYLLNNQMILKIKS